MSFHMLNGADGKKQLFCQQHTEPVGVSGHQHASRVEASGKVGLCKNQPCVHTQHRCRLRLGVYTSAYDFRAGHAQALNYNPEGQHSCSQFTKKLTEEGQGARK